MTDPRSLEREAAKRAKKDTLVGIETNPGPIHNELVESFNNEKRRKCWRLNIGSTRSMHGFSITEYPETLLPMLNYYFRVHSGSVFELEYIPPSPQLVGVELNPGPATKIIRASDNKIWTKALDPMGWQPWYCTSSRAWKAQMRKETERAVKRANRGEGAKEELKTIELLW